MVLSASCRMFFIHLKAGKEGRQSIKERRTKDVTPFGREQKKNFQEELVCSRCKCFKKEPCVVRVSVLS